MLSKFEVIGISFSILCMAVALYLIRVETSLLVTDDLATAQTAQLIKNEVVVVQPGANENQERANALLQATDKTGNLNKMVIDDIKIGVEIGRAHV